MLCKKVSRREQATRIHRRSTSALTVYPNLFPNQQACTAQMCSSGDELECLNSLASIVNDIVQRALSFVSSSALPYAAMREILVARLCRRYCWPIWYRRQTDLVLSKMQVVEMYSASSRLMAKMCRNHGAGRRQQLNCRSCMWSSIYRADIDTKLETQRLCLLSILRKP